MADTLTVRVDGKPVQLARGTTALAAIGLAGTWITRISVTGQPRSALCGMGICQECRVTIDGLPHQRACMIAAREGMDIRTGESP